MMASFYGCLVRRGNCDLANYAVAVNNIHRRLGGIFTETRKWTIPQWPNAGTVSSFMTDRSPAMRSSEIGQVHGVSFTLAPTMFTFDELCTDKWCDTFAYWLLIAKQRL